MIDNKLNLTAKNFSRAAKNYDQFSDIQKVAADKVLELINVYIPKEELILDIGCGTGGLSLKMPKHHLIQCDLSYEMCKIAGIYKPVFQADAHKLPFKENSIQNIISSSCLQWLDLHLAINEFSRILKKNGYIIFSTFTDGTLKKISNFFFKHSNRIRFLKLHSRENYHYNCSKNGLRLVEYEEIKLIKNYINIFDLLKPINKIGANINTKPDYFLSRKLLQNIENEYKGEIQEEWDILIKVYKKL